MTTDSVTKDRATLYRKIAAVTAAVSRIPKNGENTFHRYKYATESDITDGLRELLKENGLAFLPPSVISWERDETADNPKTGPRTRVQVQFAIGCCDTGEVFTAMLWGEGQDTSDKGFYKAYTGAVKYFLMKTFLIATGDDPEQRDEQQSQQQRQPAQQRPAPIQRPATNGAYEPPAEQAPAKKAPTRAGILKRISELTAEANQLDLDIVLLKPLDQMTYDELIAHGKNLAAAIEKARRPGSVPSEQLPALTTA